MLLMNQAEGPAGEAARGIKGLQYAEQLHYPVAASSVEEYVKSAPSRSIGVED